MRGSPIRTSSDQRSVGSSPRLIAASYVLHRLLVPRHPPCALNNLTTQTHPHPPTTRPDPPTPARRNRRNTGRPMSRCGRPDIRTRCSRPLCSSQTTNSHPATTHHQTPPAAPGPTIRTTHDERCDEQRSPARDERPPTPAPPHSGAPGRPVPSGPNSVPTTGPPPTTAFHSPRERGEVLAAARGPPVRTGQRSTLELHPTHDAGTPRRAPVTARA